jgi:serine protease Do
VPVTIVELQDEKSTPGKPAAKKPAQGATANAFGLTLSAIPQADRRQLGVEGGVLVESATGAAASAGIEPGDVLLQWNNTPLTSVEQFAGLLAKHDKAKPVALLVQRDGATQYLTIKPRP